jgi:hypothetical protein
MEKTLVRFFGGAVMACGTLLGLPTSAHAQTLQVDGSGVHGGSAHQPVAQVIRVTNMDTKNAADNVTVSFRAPKGAKIDSSCQVDHLPGGFRSYTCEVGPLAPGQYVDITFSLSMTQTGTDAITVEANGDVAGGGPVSGGGEFYFTIS